MAKKFLNSSIEFAGALLKDDLIAKSVTLQSPFVLQYPNSTSTKSLLLITRKLLKLQPLGVNTPQGFSQAAGRSPQRVAWGDRGDSGSKKNFFERFISHRNFSLEVGK